MPRRSGLEQTPDCHLGNHGFKSHTGRYLRQRTEVQMSNNNEKKSKLLGEGIGAATGKLRKAILWDLLVKLNLNICFQCGQPIETIQELSIEHKLPWQSADDPKVTFYDLTNIAFSHLKCNVDAADHYRNWQNKQDIKHGTDSCYHARKCRCDLCREAHRIVNQEWDKRVGRR